MSRSAVLTGLVRHAEECLWTAHQWRQLEGEAKQACDNLSEGKATENSVRYDVIEVFSPPRFVIQAATRGPSFLSADLLTGWDFQRPRDRDLMRKLVRESLPHLLVLCPPCTWSGGWFHLNKLYMTPDEYRYNVTLSKQFLNFCAELAQAQLDAGGRVMFEHPLGSSVWSMPRFQALRKRMFEGTVDMCVYGLKIPDGTRTRKSTRLLVSHRNMTSMGQAVLTRPPRAPGASGCRRVRTRNWQCQPACRPMYPGLRKSCAPNVDGTPCSPWGVSGPIPD